MISAPTQSFPLTADRPQTRRRGRADRPGRAGDSDEIEFYRYVDAALGAYLRLHPAPLVLVGSERSTAAFRRVSVNCERLAGAVAGNLTQAGTDVLSARIRTVLDQYLLNRQQEALDLIDKRAGAGRVASGMPAAWLAARTSRPEVLAVDESLFFPARLSDDGDTLIPARDVEHPDVVDDAVDELIELVLTRGGWVAFTSPGALEQHDGVALAVRR